MEVLNTYLNNVEYEHKVNKEETASKFDIYRYIRFVNIINTV